MANTTLNARVLLRNDTAANWVTNNTFVLMKGEVGIEIDTLKYKVGDGTSAWSALSYAPFGDMVKSIYDTDGDGKVNSAVVADKLSAAKTFALTGDATGSVSSDLSGGVSIAVTVVDDSHNHTIANVDNLQTSLDAKAPTSHADAATTYGIASATLYGHAMASGATPLVAGTAAVGTDNGKFAREGHVHPLQPSAATLTTARTIAISGGATGTATSFNGGSNITIPVTALDATKLSGIIPTACLPSYVDDILEAYIVGATPLASDWLSLTEGGAALTPEQGKVYVILTSGAYQNKPYRYSGTVYVAITNALDLATQAEAEAGTENTKVMTALRVSQAVTAQRAYGSTTAALTSGGTGAAGSSSAVSRADHTHTLPAYPTTLPPNGTAGGDLTGSYPNPTIADGKVDTACIAAGAVTNEKIGTVDVAKVFVNAGDTLILNGGTSVI